MQPGSLAILHQMVQDQCGKLDQLQDRTSKLEGDLRKSTDEMLRNIDEVHDLIATKAGITDINKSLDTIMEEVEEKCRPLENVETLSAQQDRTSKTVENISAHLHAVSQKVDEQEVQRPDMLMDSLESTVESMLPGLLEKLLFKVEGNKMVSAHWIAKYRGKEGKVVGNNRYSGKNSFDSSVQSNGPWNGGPLHGAHSSNFRDESIEANVVNELLDERIRGIARSEFSQKIDAHVQTLVDNECAHMQDNLEKIRSHVGDILADFDRQNAQRVQELNLLVKLQKDDVKELTKKYDTVIQREGTLTSNLSNIQNKLNELEESSKLQKSVLDETSIIKREDDSFLEGTSLHLAKPSNRRVLL